MCFTVTLGFAIFRKVLWVPALTGFGKFVGGHVLVAMSFHVSLELAGLCAGVVANVALERFLTRVRSPVHDEIALKLKWLAAILAESVFGRRGWLLVITGGRWGWGIERGFLRRTWRWLGWGGSTGTNFVVVQDRLEGWLVVELTRCRSSVRTRGTG